MGSESTLVSDLTDLKSHQRKCPARKPLVNDATNASIAVRFRATRFDQPTRHTGRLGVTFTSGRLTIQSITPISVSLSPSHGAYSQAATSSIPAASRSPSPTLFILLYLLLLAGDQCLP